MVLTDLFIHGYSRGTASSISCTTVHQGVGDGDGGGVVAATASCLAAATAAGRLGRFLGRRRCRRPVRRCGRPRRAPPLVGGSGASTAAILRKVCEDF